jgi:hypothetical protein
MSSPAGVPPLKEFSPSMRVDVFISDWRAGLDPEISGEEKERQLYGLSWEAYLDGDYGFGLWCWHECDRLTNNLNGNVREVTRILGPGRYFGFSHRRAVAVEVPVERIYRPRKGDMSTPRTDAFVLPHYQVLCVYLVRASTGDPSESPARDRTARVRGASTRRPVPSIFRDVSRTVDPYVNGHRTPRRSAAEAGRYSPAAEGRSYLSDEVLGAVASMADTTQSFL